MTAAGAIAFGKKNLFPGQTPTGPPALDPAVRTRDTARMTAPFFFGYGSLVNRTTHDYADAHPAQASGWRRAWRHAGIRPVSYLTVLPCRETVIDGLIAHVPRGDWAALDARERAYDRLHATHQITHPLTRPAEIAIYSVPEGRHSAPTADHPILLSYLDTVIQGFLTEFGEAGARRFFDTTDGWDAPILNDRAAPVYPRAKPLRTEERDFVDGCLKAIGAGATAP